MKYFIGILLLATAFALPAEAQQRDSAYYQRIDDRVDAMVRHFTEHVSRNASLIDTAAYIQRLLASHIESKRLRTTDERHLMKIYAYALTLRDGRFKKVFPEDVLERYAESFEGSNTGFSFCPVCRYRRTPEADRCGNCGEP